MAIKFGWTSKFGKPGAFSSGHSGGESSMKPGAFSSGYGGGHSGMKPQSGRGGAVDAPLRMLYDDQMGFAVGHYCAICNDVMPLTGWYDSELAAADAANAGNFGRTYGKPQSGRGGGYGGGHSGHSGGESSMKPQSGRGGEDTGKPGAFSSGYGGGHSGYGGGHSAVELMQDDYGWFAGSHCPCCNMEHRLSDYYPNRRELLHDLQYGDEIAVLARSYGKPQSGRGGDHSGGDS